MEDKKAEERKHIRKMPKWSKNMPAECFMRIMRYMPFRFVFTDYAVLNRQTRTIIFKNYALITKERLIRVDLSSSTKILKKLPRFM